MCMYFNNFVILIFGFFKNCLKGVEIYFYFDCVFFFEFFILRGICWYFFFFCLRGVRFGLIG